MSLKLFISYAKEDQGLALQYCDRFTDIGTSPWIDARNILPGQNWEAEIDKALSEANVVILLLSKKSVSKRGFVQREANEALDRLRYKLMTDIYVIPLLLEPCDVPSNISGRLQYIDLNESGSWEKVKASIEVAANQQSIQLAQGVSVGPFKVFTHKIDEEWQGSPGYVINIEYPRFESVKQPEVAKELSMFFAGRAANTLIHARQKPWEQSPDEFKSTDGFSAMDGRWDDFAVVYATDSFLGLAYNVGWYGAGAAHPNSGFETFNFSFTDRLLPVKLEDFFIEPYQALKLISKICIQELLKEFWQRTGEQPDEHQIKQFNEGAGENFDNFSSFTVNQDHFTFLFAPYQVSAYALGKWSVNVSYFDLLQMFKSDGPYQFVSMFLENNT